MTSLAEAGASPFHTPPEREERQGQQHRASQPQDCLEQAAAAVTCLWPSVFGTQYVTAALIRDRSPVGYDLALVTTDTAVTAAQVIER